MSWSPRPKACRFTCYGSGLVSRVMRTLHPDLAEGDAFLHNDPYDGNTHAADHTILVPMFFDGEHRFTGVVQGTSGRHRERGANHVLPRRRRRLRRGCTDLSLRAHAARLRRRAGHHPDVHAAHPSARGLVRRLPRNGRGGANRGASSPASSTTSSAPAHRRLRARMARLRRAPRRREAIRTLPSGAYPRHH